MKDNLKKLGHVALVAIGTVVSAISYLVLLVATATVMPVSKAYHSGRLSAEHAYSAQHAVEAYVRALGNVLDGDAKESATEDTSSTGAYL